MAPEQPEKQQQQRVTLGSDDQELIHTVLLPWFTQALALCAGSIRGLAAHWSGWFGGGSSLGAEQCRGPEKEGRDWATACVPLGLPGELGALPSSSSSDSACLSLDRLSASPATCRQRKEKVRFVPKGSTQGRERCSHSTTGCKAASHRLRTPKLFPHHGWL